MSIFNIAFTAPANPDGASTRLSVDDLWQGCVLLAQAPELFTSAVSCCEAEQTSPGRMIRSLKFRDEKIPALKQELVLVDKHKFECTTLNAGNRVTTIIYRGLSEDPDDLYLSLEYGIPYNGLNPDGTEGERFRENYVQKARDNLRDGLETMRKLKAEGKLHQTL